MEVVAYNRYSRWLHWLIAGLILFTVFLGWRIDIHDSLRLSRINLHKSIGITILLLSFLRLGLRLVYKAPPAAPGPAWERLAAKSLHVLFYVVMIGMPLTGWLMVSTSAREIPFFGLFAWPHLPVPQTHEAHEFYEFIHKLVAKILIYGMIPLHVLAALKHQFVDKDEVMQHMVPGLAPKPVVNWRWLLPFGVAGLAAALGYSLFVGTPEKGGEGPPRPAEVAAPAAPVAAPAPASASVSASAASPEAPPEAATVATWTVDKAATKIAFATTFQGETINGAFGNYSAVIAFDPDQLDKSHIKVSIDLTSVASGDDDRDSTLKSDSFFNIAKTPKAVFEAKKFTKAGGANYVAHGTLSLHGVTRPFDLPFSLLIKDDRATVTAQAKLDRTKFGVGSGDYADTDTIPADVQLQIKLRARRSK